MPESFALLRRRVRVSLVLVALLTFGVSLAGAVEPELLVDKLENPESAAIGHDGRLYVTVIGKSGTDGDGSVAVVEDGQATTFAKGLDDPKGLVAHGENLFVADKNRVWKIDAAGSATVFAAAEAFPATPKFLNDITADDDGTLYVTDCGTFITDGAVYRISPAGEVSIVTSHKQFPVLKAPNGVLVDDDEHLLIADFTAGKLYRVNLADGTPAELASKLGGADGLARDAAGRIFTSDWRGGKVFEIVDGQPKLLSDKFESAADIAFDTKTGKLLVPDMKAGTVSTLPLAD